MSAPYDDPASSRFEVPSAVLAARVRQGDGLALDDLCERFVPFFQGWWNTRVAGGSVTLPDIPRIIRHALLRLVHDTGTELKREGSFLLVLRRAVGEKIETEDARAGILEQTLGREKVSLYEVCLRHLDGLEQEAIVCRLEMGRDAEQLASDLDVPSPEEASRIFQRAFVRLAEHMARQNQGDHP